MIAFNDVLMSALTALGFTTGAINFRWRSFLKANGATSDVINEAEMQYLIARAIPRTELNDMWFVYLRGKAYTGSLNDMRMQWVVAGLPL